MRNLKRCTSLILAFSFLLISLSPVAGLRAKENEIFTDVIENHPAYEQIKNLKDRGVVSGYADNKYFPENKINRAEFLKIAMEYKKQEGGGENCFTDVTNQWFAQYVCGAADLGLVKGYNDGSFKPEQEISFVEATKILVEINKANLNFKPSDYKDSWYHPYVMVLEEKKAIPFSIEDFSYKITRGEMAQMIVSLNSYSNSHDDYKKHSLNYSTLNNNSDISDSNNGFKSRKIFLNNFKEAYQKELSLVGVPKEVDAPSFAMYSLTVPNLYMDKDNIYCYSAKKNPEHPQLIKLENADVSTLQVDGDILYTYVTDKNSIYRLDATVGCYLPLTKIDGNKKKIYRNIYADAENVYYFQYNYEEQGYDFIEVPRADGATFKASGGDLDGVIGGKFFEDKNDIYAYSLEKLTKYDFDKETIERVTKSSYYGGSSQDWLIFKDKNGVYFTKGEYLYEVHAFEGADRETFEVMRTNPFGDIGIYAKDKSAIYTVNGYDYSVKRFDDIDMETFQNIKTQGEDFEHISFYSKDENHVYKSDFSILEWADPETFKVSGIRIYYDDSFIYGSNKTKLWIYSNKEKTEKMIDDIDANTFEIVSVFSFSKKEKVEDRNKDLCEELKNNEIDSDINSSYEELGCDDSSLKLEKVYYIGLIAKDKNSVWYYDESIDQFVKLNGIDTQTIMLVKDYSNIFKDKNGVYYPKDGTLTLIPDVDSDTVQIKHKGYDLYLIDKNSAWIYNDELESFSLTDKLSFDNEG